MREQSLFSPVDREAIRAAVAQAESRTGAEVVPWIAPACDTYPEASWKGAAGGALLGLGLGWLSHRGVAAWGGLLWWAVLPALLGATAGFLLGRLPAVQRLLVDEDDMERRVRTAAEAAFLEAEVFATRDRTGVLLFLALLEHRVVVLGDSGVNARVQPAEWQAIADEVVAGIRRGEAPATLVRAIDRCGCLLVERGVARAAADRNELPDQPRFGEEP